MIGLDDRVIPYIYIYIFIPYTIEKKSDILKTIFNTNCFLSILLVLFFFIIYMDVQS